MEKKRVDGQKGVSEKRKRKKEDVKMMEVDTGKEDNQRDVWRERRKEGRKRSRLGRQ